MKKKKSSDLIEFGNRHFNLVLDIKTGAGEVFHLEDGRNPFLIGRIRYVARLFGGGRSKWRDMKIVSFRKTGFDEAESLMIECESGKKLRVSLELGLRKNVAVLDVNVVVKNISDATRKTGLKVFCLDLACETIRARFLPGLYSGWTCEGRSLVVYPVFVGGQLCQMGLVAGFERRDAMTINALRQGVALNLPTVMSGGVAELDPGERWTGGMVLSFGNEDIWDPALLKQAERFCPPAEGVQAPAHSYDEHIANWERFISNDDLWVELGAGMGMFHRGFYGMIRFGEKRVSGALRYDEDRCIGTGNERLIELSWGGSNNALLAYTMFCHDKDWSRARGDAIINAACGFKTDGFQQASGPCAGAWHNGYYPDLNKFGDRYDRDTIYTPDQGIANYFLGKCLIENLVDNPRLAEMIALNCAKYLPVLDNGRGGLVMARRLDGSPGGDRYARLYDGDKADLAMPAAMGSLSYLMDYRINGNGVSLAEGERLLDHLLEKVEANEWRFHEYDTWGWDNMSMCWILTTLCEWSKKNPDQRLDAAVEKTLQALFSCRFGVDYCMDAYSTLERCWGGRMKGRGGFVGGSSVKSMHGGNSLHNRFDTSLALWTHYSVTGDPRSYAALVDFLNNLTWHQWKRSDLPVGYGAVTEAVHLDEGHIQDTAQTLHSNCLYHILLNKKLFLESSAMNVSRVSLPKIRGDKLRFRLKSGCLNSGMIAIGGSAGSDIKLQSNGETLYVGAGTNIFVELPGSGKEREFFVV